MGFALCLILVLLIWLIKVLWFKNTLVLRTLKQNQQEPDIALLRKRFRFVWITVLGFMFAGLIVLSITFNKQNAKAKHLINDQKSQIFQMGVSIDSLRKSNQGFFLNNVLQLVDEDLRNSPTKTLRKETIGRIASLSKSFLPYKFLSSDHVLDAELSPERGQLLLSLLSMGMDSASFSEVKAQTTFARAYLKNSDLNKMDLSNIDLRFADMGGCNLTGTNLRNAQLNEVNLRKAELDHANLSGAFLRGATLEFATLNHANLSNANLNGARLDQVVMRNAIVKNALIQWAYLNGVLLEGADFTGTDLVRSEMQRANFTKANLKNTNFYRVVLTNAILDGIYLDSAEVKSDWLESLKKNPLQGSENIVKDYRVDADSTDPKKLTKYFLVKRSVKS
jgi:uncharacterized protein YjbI with pentapeptide repeats